MLDPIKETIITPGLDVDGDFADWGIIVLGRWLTHIVDDLLLPEVRPMWYKHAWHDDAGG